MEWIKERVGDGASWGYFSVSLDLSKLIGVFSFVPLSEFVGRPSWTKSG